MKDPPHPDAHHLAKVKNEGVHTKNRKSHDLTKYDYTVFADDDFEIRYSWAMCESCKAIIWKQAVAYNNRKMTCYVRDIFSLK